MPRSGVGRYTDSDGEKTLPIRYRHADFPRRYRGKKQVIAFWRPFLVLLSHWRKENDVGVILLKPISLRECGHPYSL